MTSWYEGHNQLHVRVTMKHQPAGKTKPGHRVERLLHCCTETEMGRNTSVLYSVMLRTRKKISLKKITVNTDSSAYCFTVYKKWHLLGGCIMNDKKGEVITGMFLQNETLSACSNHAGFPHITLRSRLLVNMTVPLTLCFKFFCYDERLGLRNYSGRPGVDLFNPLAPEFFF